MAPIPACAGALEHTPPTPILISGGLNLHPQAQPSKLRPDFQGVRDPLWLPHPPYLGPVLETRLSPGGSMGPGVRSGVPGQETAPEPLSVISGGTLCFLGSYCGLEGELHRCAPPTSHARRKGEVMPGQALGGWGVWVGVCAGQVPAWGVGVASGGSFGSGEVGAHHCPSTTLGDMTQIG